jgi:hypothetical protein
VVAKVRSHFLHNIVGYVALMFALSGTAYAMNTVGSDDIVDGAIESRDVSSSVLPKIDSATMGRPDPEHRYFASLEVGVDGDYDYLLLASFATNDAGQYLCHLKAQGYPEQLLRGYGSGSQAMFLVVNPERDDARKTIKAGVWCDGPQVFLNARIIALRVAS